jgi:capsular polysaccharide biosynthesis protein
MFGRAELRQIRKAAERDPLLDRLGDWVIARAVCQQGGDPAHTRILAAGTSVPYYPPEHVFGTPFDPHCLDGVTVAATSLAVPDIAAHELDDATVIGFNAALDGKNRLFCLGAIRTEDDAARLLKRSFLEQDGFLLTREQGELIVRYGRAAEPKRYTGTAVFISNNEPGNYGRFLLGALPQLIYLREYAPAFDYYVTSDRASWFGAAVAELGLPEKPVFTIREVCGDSFDRLIMLDDVHGNGIMSAFIRDALRDLAQRFAARSTRDHADRIYVSRALSRAARARYRLMVNEVDEIERAAADRGFAVVYPETLSWQEQIALFRRARTIAGPSGSGMLNAAFAPAGTRLIDLESVHSTLRQHARTYASTEKQYAFGFGVLDEADPNPTVSFRRWTLPLAVFHQGLDWLTG